MKSDQLKRIHAESKVIAERFGVDFRVGMKACAIARKRSCEVDGTIINEAKQMMDAKKNAKSDLRAKELAHGKVLRLYSEHLLETLVAQNEQIIKLLRKVNP